jgi:hypothetical protein|tara:strand:+ start:144 stop:332 length:189 start_codon:yes stop_codon:yes gene_type:complete
MSAQTSIQLDVSSEASLADVQYYAREYNCTAELVTEFGPAGGNPVYEFFGRLEDLQRLEAEF